MLNQKKQMPITLDYYYSGSSVCNPGHNHGPALRDHYLIHYIHSGKGIFETNDKNYSLSAHNGFLISPGSRFYYKADMVDPWHYSWVAFKGGQVEEYLVAAGLSTHNPVFYYELDEQLTDCIHQLNTVKKETAAGTPVKLTGLVFILLSLLISSAQKETSQKRVSDSVTGKLYVDRALDYMYKNYSRNVKIHDIASFLNINRRYLTSLFNQQTGSSPHEMLVQLRMRKACELMRDSSISISEIARSVGYEDPLQFSKIFKKHLHRSPRQFRSQTDL